MVPFLDTGLSTIFRLFNVEVALCVTTAARRAAEFSTEELVRKDRISDSDRISKIRARHGTRNEESYNYISGHTGSNGNANRGAICVDMEEARKVARDVSLPVLDGERPDHCTPGERPA
jgi:hypothetical protein